jgi:hypothetical protein
MVSLLTREAFVRSRVQALSLLGVGVGVAVWLVATVVFRFVGHLILSPDDPGRLALVFVVTVLTSAMIAFAVYPLLDVPPERRLTAATLLVLPGMALDAVVVTAFETVYPDMAVSTGSALGGLLLFAYAAVLVTGVVPLTYAPDDDPAEQVRVWPDNALEQPGEPPDGDTVGED